MQGSEVRQIGGLLDALNCGAVVIDRAGRVVHINQRLCELLRRPRSQLIGREITSLYRSASDRGVIRTALAAFGEPLDAEFYLPQPDGGKLPIVVAARGIVEGDAAAPQHLVVTLIDISKQKEAEQSLRDQYRIIAELSNRVFGQAEKLQDYSSELERRVRERTAQLHAAHLDALYMLAVASEAKDADTGQHVRRIQAYAHALARRLGLGEDDADEIGYSAVLHDVGKIHVPDEILKKPGALSPDERRRMQEHTLVGERILGTGAFFVRARRIARSHHENWDGSGYPDALAGGAIPLEARIVHLADVYDALVHARVYKPAWTPDDAARAIREAGGRMFEPDVVDAFNDLHARGEWTVLADGNGHPTAAAPSREQSVPRSDE